MQIINARISRILIFFIILKFYRLYNKQLNIIRGAEILAEKEPCSDPLPDLGNASVGITTDIAFHVKAFYSFR
jgi:hypothetical protein